jgi:LacI family transcriptional regulator
MILEFCQKAGIGVPEEIAVLGVDNDDILCSLCEPQLSSIVPDAETIGYRAAQSLHQCLLQNPGVALEQWVPPLYLHSRASTDSTATEDWVVRQALQFIHGNAVRDIGVGEVVAHTSVSRRLLEQRFRSVLGRPIHEEILRVRLGEAQRLLSGTSLPLKDVALRSGFKRADYLSAVFRNKLGISPTDYRQGGR